MEELKKLKEENVCLKSDLLNLQNIIKKREKDYIKIIEFKNKRIQELEEENYKLKNKQMTLEEL